MRRLSILCLFVLFIAFADAQTAYVAEFQMRTYAPGSSIASRVANGIEALRSDGSLVHITEWFSTAGGPLRFYEIVDLTKRQMVRTDPLTQSKTTRYLSQAEVALYVAAADGCKYASIAEANPDMMSTRLGNRVVLTFTHDHAAQWVAPELGCAVLESSVAWADGGHQERSVVKIASIEPGEEYFTVPDSFVERTAEQIDAIYRSKYGVR